MACNDIPSLLDLQEVKKHADDFGRLMGTGTGTSTNGVTGQVRPTYNAVMSNLGYTRVGTFASGGTLTNGRQTLLWDVADGGDGQEYGWSGSFLPSGKVVPPGSTPLTTGGIAVGAWMSRFDPALRVQTREALRRSYAEAGYNLVDGSFEAGGTLVNANDVLLQERTGKAFSGPVGVVAAGTNPERGGFVDKSGELLRHEARPNADNVDLFIIYGQSNARGSAAGSAGRLPITDKAIYWSRANQDLRKMTYEMESAWPDDGINSTGHAWGAFANRYTQLTSRKTYWVPGAIGGKTITQLSKTIGQGIYEELLVEYTKALAAITASGDTIASINVVFHQGESDQSSGTTWDDYFTLLEQMIQDFRDDFAFDNFFIATVGNPTSTGRNETNWHIMRSVQEYVADRNADVTLAFEGFKYFNQQNGLLRSDGTHATQRGYNRMGQEMADSAVKTIFLESSVGGDERYLNKYEPDIVSTNRVKEIHAVIRLFNAGSGTKAEILTRNHATYGSYRSSYVTGVSLSATELVLECESLRNYAIYDVQVTCQDNVNPTEHVDAAAKITGVGNNKLGIAVRLNKDFAFTLNTNTGAEKLTKNNAASSEIGIYDTDSLDLTVETGYISLSHNASNYPRLATRSTLSGTPDGTSGLLIASPSSSETRIARNIGLVNVFIPSFTIRPNSVKSGTELFIHVSAKATNKAE